SDTRACAQNFVKKTPHLRDLAHQYFESYGKPSDTQSLYILKKGRARKRKIVARTGGSVTGHDSLCGEATSPAPLRRQNGCGWTRSSPLRPGKTPRRAVRG